MGKFELSPSPDSFESDSRLATLRDDVREWTAGRWWAIRIPLLAYLLWALLSHLRDPWYGSLLFSGITLLIHEIGHVIFGFLPQFLAIAGGTVLQIVAPVITALIFLRQPDYFGVTVAGVWLSFSLFNVSTYVEDARSMDLPLVSVGSGEIIHDWNYMLTALGLLEQEQLLSDIVRLAAGCVGFASILGGAWLVWLMFLRRGEKRRVWSF